VATRAVKLWNPAVAMAAVRRLRNLACSRAVAVANYIINPSVVQNSGPASWPSFMNYATMSARKKGGWERCGRAGEMEDDDYGSAWDTRDDGFGYSREVEVPHWNPRRKKAEDDKKKKNTKRSFKARSEKCMKPFTLDIFFSTKYIHASIMHRVTSKVVAVASTNAKEFRGNLKSYRDFSACKVIGKTLAERAIEADVYTVVYEPRKGEKFEGKLAAVVGTVEENGVHVHRPVPV
jgi:large subunit ribosomal protein L18